MELFLEALAALLPADDELAAASRLELPPAAVLLYLLLLLLIWSVLLVPLPAVDDPVK